MVVVVNLRKCPYDHWLTNKAYLSAITVTNISQSFYLQDGGKNQLAYCANYVTDTLCIAMTSKKQRQELVMYRCVNLTPFKLNLFRCKRLHNLCALPCAFCQITFDLYLFLLLSASLNRSLQRSTTNRYSSWQRQCRANGHSRSGSSRRSSVMFSMLFCTTSSTNI